VHGWCSALLDGSRAGLLGADRTIQVSRWNSEQDPIRRIRMSDNMCNDFRRRQVLRTGYQ
jgi:hypothetical protein